MKATPIPLVLCSNPPRKTDLICPYCDKKYSSQFYFRRHVESHTNTTAANASQAIHLDVSNISFSELTGTASQTPTFKLPAQPKNKKTVTQKPKPKPKYTCTYCLKGYICQRSFKAHIRSHVIQDAAAKFPDKEKILAEVETAAEVSLTKVSNAPSSGITGASFRELVGHVISVSCKEEWKQFTSKLSETLLADVISQKHLLPSALISTLFSSVESTLADAEFCKELLSMLNIPPELSHVQFQFILEFTLNLGEELLSFICKTFRAGYRPLHINKPQLDDDDKQVVFYIAGSIIRGYLRIAHRYKTSTTWQDIVKVLKSNALQERPSTGQQQDASWTLAVDRGGLLYISSKSQEFFLSLTEVVFTCEKRDGSIDYDEVIAQVSNSNVSVLWDNIISNALSESNSLALMNDIIRCFCRTCGSGFAKRRLNFLKTKPLISMPTRHAVATRKK